MGFVKQTAKFDLGDTPIENIFINDFMPMANGTYVKVYLLGYKYAHDKDASICVNHETISKHLDIPLSDVLNAWDFWEKKGTIKKHPESEDDPTQYTVEFLSLKQLYIDNNFKALNILDREDTSSSSYSCSPGDLIEANKVPEIKKMFYEVNQLMRRSLVPNEMMEILQWIYNYNMDPDLIIRGFMYCIERKNIKNIKYVGAVMRNWYDQGITTIEKLDNFLEKTDERYIHYQKIFKFLGFHFREPSQAEKETMDRWLDQWHFDINIILRACENSKKTSNPNINYIDSILKSWNTQGIKSIEDINHLENNPTIKQTLTKKEGKKAPNRFHNFEQRTSKYSSEELEKIVRNKR